MMATVITMQTREDSVISPPRTPATPSTPKTPERSKTTILQPPSPSLPPQSPIPETVLEKGPILEPTTFNAYIPPGFRHHHVPADISQSKRTQLNYAAHTAHHTQADAMKFHRIVEWDGTWLSTLSLPPLEFFSNVQYLETTFPEIYPSAEGIARVQQCWKEGPEPDYGLAVDVNEADGSESRSVAEALFDFEGYYGEQGEPEETAAEKAEWQLQSQKLKNMISCTSMEATVRANLEDETQTRWSNQR